MYSWERWARSMRTPEATITLRTPGTSRLSRISWTSGPWSVPSSLQILGWTHESRLHRASTSGLVQRIWYMLAVGPPMSETTPEKPGSWPIRRSSARTEAGDRDGMIRPWWAVIEQNVQPPKHPRMIVTESLTTSYAGIFWPLYIGCGWRV